MLPIHGLGRTPRTSELSNRHRELRIIFHGDQSIQIYMRSLRIWRIRCCSIWKKVLMAKPPLRSSILQYLCSPSAARSSSSHHGEVTYSDDVLFSHSRQHLRPGQNCAMRWDLLPQKAQYSSSRTTSSMRAQ